MPDEPIGQTDPTPIPADPIVIPTTQSVVDETQPVVQVEDADAASQDRQRDEQGRFVGKEGTPAEAESPKFSPQMMDLARSVQLTDEQINSFSDPSMLFDVIQGRQAQMAPPPAAPQASVGQVTGYTQPQTTTSIAAPVVEPVLEDFKLELDENEVAPELAKPVKALAEHVNKLKAGLVKQVSELRAQNAELQVGIRESAARVQQATTQQQAGMWDGIAESIPGMVDAIGKPSVAMANMGGSNAKEWSDLAPFIAARAQSQRVPENLIDYSKAAQEGWTAYLAVKGNGNGQSSGNPSLLPGVAVRSAPRVGAAPVAKTNLTAEQDYDQRLSFLESAWKQAGGNPFAI